MEKRPSSNAWLKSLCHLGDKKVRDREGVTLFEGPRLLREALSAGCVRQILVADEASARNLPSDLEVPIHVVGPIWIERLAAVRAPQSVIGIGSLPPPRTLEAVLRASDRVLVLDRVQDPGNVGALIRTALALGIEGVVCTPGCADAANPKVVRASAGAVFHLPRAEATLAHLEQVVLTSGHVLVVPKVRGGQDVRDLDAPNRFAICAGNEGGGTTLESGRARLEVTIPMAERSESLNVAAAIAVILGLWSR